MESNWYKASNYICILATANECELSLLELKAQDLDIKHSVFREEDLGNQLTALALAPGDKTRKLCSGLPLAGKYLEPSTWPTRAEIIESMTGCEQTSGQNLLQHGELVYDWYKFLVSLLAGNPIDDRPYRLPDWFTTYSQGIYSSLLPDQVTSQYLLYHDCGKGFCKTLDDQSRPHYPDHAKTSANIYFHAFTDQHPETRARISSLIAEDMDIHKLKAENLEAFSLRTNAITLLIAGLAEIHANSQMFGGLDSDSFKIKFKQLDRRGKQLCNLLL